MCIRDSLQRPDEAASIAVDARQELDLRLGAAFTRFNTLCVKRNGVLALLGENGGGGGEREDGRGNDRDNKTVISYGPCQFPTLGFIVQRKWDVDAHVPTCSRVFVSKSHLTNAILTPFSNLST